MRWWIVAIVVSAAVPLAAAWRANRGWTIRHALCWIGLAWLAWLAFAQWPGTETAYAALSLTGASGVAVLGARRPGVTAWNIVVASLLVILWIGWAEGLLDRSGLKLGTFRLVFVAGLIGTAVANYLPTISWPAAILVGVGAGHCLISLWNHVAQWDTIGAAFVGGACWLDWVIRKVVGKSSASEFDRLWQSFRNRYGAVWSERTREQFNAAARNRQWPVHLGWRGLHVEAASSAPDQEWSEAMQSLIRRFQTSR